MKRNLFKTGVFILAILFLSSFSLRENPQDPPRGEKAKKHIVLEKTDEKGNKVSLDTIIGGNDIFVWNGDTIGDNSAFNWISKDGFDADSLLKSMNFNFEYEINENGNDKVIVLKSEKGSKQRIHEFVTNNDSNKIIRVHVNTDDLMNDNDVMIWNDEDGNKTFFGPNFSNLPHLPNAPNVRITKTIDHANVIDLSDPGIISYKKKMNKDGTEKITIVRKQVDQNEIQNMEEIIMATKSGEPNIFFSKSPDVKRIKIIKEDGKETEVEIEEETIENE